MGKSSPKYFPPQAPFGQSPVGVTSQTKAPQMIPAATPQANPAIPPQNMAPPVQQQPLINPQTDFPSQQPDIQDMRQNLFQAKVMPFYGRFM